MVGVAIGAYMTHINHPCHSCVHHREKQTSRFRCQCRACPLRSRYRPEHGSLGAARALPSCCYVRCDVCGHCMLSHIPCQCCSFHHMTYSHASDWQLHTADSCVTRTKPRRQMAPLAQCNTVTALLPNGGQQLTAVPPPELL